MKYFKLFCSPIHAPNTFSVVESYVLVSTHRTGSFLFVWQPLRILQNLYLRLNTGSFPGSILFFGNLCYLNFCKCVTLRIRILYILYWNGMTFTWKINAKRGIKWFSVVGGGCEFKRRELILIKVLGTLERKRNKSINQREARNSVQAHDNSFVFF